MIFFEDIIFERKKVNDFINSTLGIEIKAENKNYSPPVYKNFSSEILDQCNVVYQKLLDKKKY